MMFTNKVYDVLKWVTLVFLPALGTLYVTLAPVWGFPYAEQISTTVIAVVTFLGIILQLSNMQYNKYANMPVADDRLISAMNPAPKK